MGIGIEVHEFEKHVLGISGLQWPEISICELGNQKIKFLKHRLPAGRYYRKLGVKYHISLDLNGKNGAMAVDLDKPVPGKLLNKFDLVTDYGTIEHVNNQYQVFRNMHDVCKEGGIMLHALPPSGHWPGHGRYYYSESFFEQLARICNYSPVTGMQRVARDGREYHDLLLVALRKHQSPFPGKELFGTLPLEDSGNTATTGNYTSKKRNSPEFLKKLRSVFQ